MINKKKILTIFLVAILFISIFAKKCYKQYRVSQSNVYSIARITKVGFGDADICYYNFYHQNRIIEGETIIPTSLWGRLHQIKVGEKYLVRFVKNELWVSDLQFKYPVPNCVKDAPSEGWEGIPDFTKMCE